MKPKWFSIVIGAVLLTGLALVATPQMAMAATCTTNGSRPLWSYSAAWDCGYVPAAGDPWDSHDPSAPSLQQSGGG